jgi:UDP-N-acetylmuramoyl-tripeptide--D-alanyl-D-alanine ligase
MRELGPQAPMLHARVGGVARAAGIARLYAVGGLAAAAAGTFGSKARYFTNQSELIAALTADVHPGVSVLVKGSRGSAMDRVVRALLEGSGGNGGGTRNAA